MTPQREEALRYLKLAERDRTAYGVLAAAAGVDVAIAGFHAQQAVEKALKAVLIDRGVEFRRTHDLQVLADRLANDLQLLLPVSDADLRRLAPFAVEARYQIMGDIMAAPDEIAGLMNTLVDWAIDTIDGHRSEG